MKTNKWTEKETALLRRHYATATWQELCSLLPGRSATSISRKASKLKLHRGNGSEDWTEEEMNILIRNYPRMQAKHLQALLPHRSLASIYRKANDLCLSAYDNTVTDRIIRENFGKSPLNQIAKQLGSYCSSIRYRAQALGLL